MRVSFIIVAYNEEKTLGTVFKNLEEQTYNHKKIEVILVDGMSTDKTKEMMEQFQKENSFERVIIKDNPKKTLPCGWNVALKEAKGDIILRIDAHATIPKEFIQKNVECIASGEKICGGYRPNIIEEKSNWQKTLLLVEQSLFGSSVASYRRNGEKRYVKSVFHGAYCKEVFDKVGLYNENLARTEDNEMHYRMRQAGYKICFDPNIISYQHTRNSLKKMLKQKYMNGFWIGVTLRECPQCFSFYHFIPFAFVCSIIISVCSIPLIGSEILKLIIGSYLLVDFGMSVLAMLNNRLRITNVVLPILFFCLHILYGVGTMMGIAKAIFKKEIKGV